MSRTGKLARLLIGASLVGFGCTGSINGGTGPDKPGEPPEETGGGGSGGGGMTGPKPTTPKPGETPNLAGAMPLRRLTIFELNNTLRDLLGDTSNAGDKLAVDLPTAVGYSSGAKIVTSVDARAFLDMGSTLTEAVAAKLATLLPQGCSAPQASGEEGCATQFIKQFGLRAYRRPLAADEEADLLTLYKKQRTAEIGAGYLDAIRVLISGMIQSPYFLYRWELGGAPQMDGVLVKLNSYEIASRLSYFLWATMPDTKLFEAAAAGLQTPDKITAEARRMMGDGKFKDGLKDFSLQWLGVSGIPTLEKDESFMNYNAEVGQAMEDETVSFFTNLMFGPQATGKLADLHGSSKSKVSPALAKLYGTTAGGDGTVTFKGTERAGILTQAAFLTAHAEPDGSHPVKRGVHVLRGVLCRDIPGPPDGLMIPPLAEREPGQTTRQRFEAGTSGKMICESCHNQINPVGFAFENYDAVGQYRTMEENKMIDASGTLKLNPSGEIQFANAVELSKALANNDEVRSCMSKQWLRYVLRRMEVADEAGSFAVALDDFAKSGYDLRELLVSTTKTRAFTHRQPQQGEGQK
jgi:hypothetical protein